MFGSAPGPAARALPEADLAHVLAHTGDLWRSLDGARVLITGGTGFFGRWLVGSALAAASAHRIRLGLVVLTRDRRRFASSAPEIVGDPRVHLIEGDVRSFDIPPGDLTHVIHAAGDVKVSEADGRPRPTGDTIVEGTRHVLAAAAERGVAAVLYTSSGAVYGRQPPELSRVTEDFEGTLDPAGPWRAYAEGKRAAEDICVTHGRSGLAVKVARCFSFVGPHMRMDDGMAIASFVRDALRGGHVSVRGDGSAFRSYLYAADLAVWLWSILVRGASGRPYNVGSEHATTIADVARRVAEVTRAELRIGSARPPGTSPDRYVPSTARARGELGLLERIGLDEAIARTLRWYGPEK